MIKVQIEPRHMGIVQEILSTSSADVYAFGSRTKGTARPLSDLDLCIMDQVDSRSLRKLKDQFEESNLPFKVDIILWSEISESFREQIQKDLMPLRVK